MDLKNEQDYYDKSPKKVPSDQFIDGFSIAPFVFKFNLILFYSRFLSLCYRRAGLVVNTLDTHQALAEAIAMYS